MEIINIAATNLTPKVLLDREKHVFELEGESRPENVYDFYFPIITELIKFLECLHEDNSDDSPSISTLKANFKLFYFNSSSAKFIVDIISLLKTFNDKGLDIGIYWYFNEGDDDIKEAGEELSEMVSFRFNYVMIKQ